MEENRINEIGKMSLPDKVCNILKAIGSCCSFTAPIVSLLSDFQTHKQNLLIEDVLKTAFAMIDELDNRVRNMEYIKSQEFIYDLLRTVDYSKDEIDENKRIMYAKPIIKSGERKNQEKRWESVGFLIPWAYGGGQRETRKGQDETEERYQIVTYGVGRDWIDSEEWGWLRMCG